MTAIGNDGFLPWGTSAPAPAAASERERHTKLVNEAVADGRLVEGERATWVTALTRGGVKAERVLASLASTIAARQTRVEDTPWFPGSSSARRGVAS